MKLMIEIHQLIEIEIRINIFCTQMKCNCNWNAHLQFN